MTEIGIETMDGVMRLTLQRPEKKNAITDAMYGTIAETLNGAAADAAVRCVVLSGAGPDFCAGNDIGMFKDATPDDIVNSNVDPFLTALSTFPKPLVAAVTGRAIGVGVTMLLHCDLVYAAEDAQLVLPFVNLGLVPEAGSGLLLPMRIGHVRAFELFALGDPVTGAEAARIGLANAALPAGEVLQAAMAAAERLAAKSPSSLAATKALMRDPATIAAAIAADRDAFLRQLQSPEAAAAFAAFAARKG